MTLNPPEVLIFKQLFLKLNRFICVGDMEEGYNLWADF